MTDANAVDRVLDFWFGPEGSAGRGADREIWWMKDDAFDSAVRDNLGALHERAAAGELDGWADDPRGCVALTILLDQVPRNLYRGTARAFATDPKARDVARRALDRGFDGKVPETMRLFLYMPFEHSETLADQQRCVELTGALSNGRYLDYAVAHRDIVARFGRFPHRNEALGRISTPEEIAFLKEPGSSF